MERWATGKELWSSTLVAVEAHRAARRLELPPSIIDELLDAITLVLPAASTFHAAQSIGVDSLRTLGALHLAAASEIGDELDSIVTYDQRLAASAAALHLTITAPGLRGSWWKPA